MSSIKPKSVLFIVPYPLNHAPSQRFRFEQYLSLMQLHGYTYDVRSFLTSQNWQVFFKSGHAWQKAFALLRGFWSRMLDLLAVGKHDFVFIHREAMPIGPPLFEWLIAKVFKKKIIFDFDDAIWQTDRQDEGVIASALKARWKIARICAWSYTLSCGNEYLCNYASRFNSRVILNPTTIDTEALHNPALHPRENKNGITVGWTGSHSTLKYLKEIETALREVISANTKRTLTIIADRSPDLAVPFNFIRWNDATEVNDLLTIDVGIMPLPDDEWSKGKCGFKALQYMALEIPAVISPVGVNEKIVSHGVDGFLARTNEEWKQYLELLLNDSALRTSIGKQGRKKVEQYYSVKSNVARFFSLFE